MSILKTIIKAVGMVVVVLTAIVLIRAAMFVPPDEPENTASSSIQPNAKQLAQNLSAAIQIQTISNEAVELMDRTRFDAFGQWLRQTYPAVFKRLELTMLNDYTFLFRWRGNKEVQPAVLFSAHYDVVPVNEDTLSQWQYPPFAGEIADGYIWGRGALDDKSAVISLIEAINLLLAKNFVPENDIYVAFTHDEEIGSEYGSKAVTAYFQENNITLDWSLDEGSFVLKGIVPGVDKDIASINVAEKGYLTLELVATGQGGHSSMPPQETAVNILASAIVKLKNHPVPGELSGISEQMYSDIARHMDFTKRLLFANLWLFKPLVNKVLGDTATGNAMIRTTTAPTMLSGSVKENVLPTSASAKINFRIHPRDSVDSVIAWVKQSIGDDRVSVRVIRGVEPSNMAPGSGAVFDKLAKTAKAVHGDVLTTPGLTIAATDSRYYSEITQSYRFNPMVIASEDLAGFHGINERISQDNMVKAVKFYAELMQQ